jgi:DNA-binding response OmpR family regulator
MKPNKILIADDEVDVLEILAKRLMQAGYEVVSAHDGEEAWKKIQSELPDVIVLDLTMPKKDGLEVIKLLREKPPTKKFQPVIIVSGRKELEDLKKGYDLEADHYLVKPCTVEEILKAIRLMIALIPRRQPPAQNS